MKKNHNAEVTEKRLKKATEDIYKRASEQVKKKVELKEKRQRKEGEPKPAFEMPVTKFSDLK